MKPKILVVSDTYHPQVDGTVGFIDEFLRRTKEDFELSLLVPRFEGESMKKMFHNTTFIEVSKIIKPLPSYPSMKISKSNLRIIKNKVKEADIVFVQGPALGSLISIHYAKRYKKKVVQYVHVIPWELVEKSQRTFLSKFPAWVVKRLYFRYYNKSDLILVPYNDLLDQLHKEGVRSKMKIAKLGIDIQRFSPSKDKGGWKKRAGLPEDSFVIGYVGRVSREKNVDILLKAVRKLPGKINARLLIVGDGTNSEVEKFKSFTRCKVTGFVDNVQDYLKAMDVFVMPSLTETTSLATLEAMSSGVAVIASKVGFIKKYVTKDHNGLFFPRSSSTLLKAKIVKLWKNDELREELGKNARRMIAYSFSWERSINRMKKYIKDLHHQ